MVGGFEILHVGDQYPVFTDGQDTETFAFHFHAGGSRGHHKRTPRVGASPLEKLPSPFRLSPRFSFQLTKRALASASLTPKTLVKHIDDKNFVSPRDNFVIFTIYKLSRNFSLEARFVWKKLKSEVIPKDSRLEESRNFRLVIKLSEDHWKNISVNVFLTLATFYGISFSKAI